MSDKLAFPVNLTPFQRAVILAALEHFGDGLTGGLTGVPRRLRESVGANLSQYEVFRFRQALAAIKGVEPEPEPIVEVVGNTGRPRKRTFDPTTLDVDERIREAGARYRAKMTPEQRKQASIKSRENTLARRAETK